MKRNRGNRGFTLVELLMVVAVTTIGFVGLFNLQATSIKGLGNMIRMAQATTLAESFISRLRLEFSSWTSTQPLTNGGAFPHLAELPTDDGAQAGIQTPGDGVQDAPGWVIGGIDGGSDRRVSIVGDAHPLGFNAGTRKAMLMPDMEDADQHFCLLYRLTWVRANRAIRVEVEISWPLPNANMIEFEQCNKAAASQLRSVRSITMNSTILVNIFKR